MHTQTHIIGINLCITKSLANLDFYFFYLLNGNKNREEEIERDKISEMAQTGFFVYY